MTMKNSTAINMMRQQMELISDQIKVLFDHAAQLNDMQWKLKQQKTQKLTNHAPTLRRCKGVKARKTASRIDFRDKNTY